MSDQVICHVIDPVVASQCLIGSHIAAMPTSPEVEVDDLRLVVR
jgi:hypothetical protein